jgi:poly-gamma-glutamate synthesis protein (capsule biosynthesis protein)
MKETWFFRPARILTTVLILISCSVEAKNHPQLSGGQIPGRKKRYEQVRIEGQSYWKAILSGPAYYRKYIRKKPGSSPAITDYFRYQEEIRGKLRTSDTLPAAVKLAFFGDIMWIWYGWSNFLDPEILSELEEQDIVLSNLETPVDPGRRVSQPVIDHPAYNSPPELLTSFNRRGQPGSTLTAVSICNNHTLDRGATGALATRNLLDSLGICHTGTTLSGDHSKPYCLIRRNNIRIGFYGTSWGTNKGDQAKGDLGLRVNTVPGLAPLKPDDINIAEVDSVLKLMKRDSVDFRIISIHWGFEFENYPDPAIMETAHRLVAAGADLIIGSHPHVSQPNEVCFVNGIYPDLAPFQIRTSDSVPRKALISYSSGNFSTAMLTKECRTGQIQFLKLCRDPETQRIDWTLPEIRKIYNENGRQWGAFRRVRWAEGSPVK